MIGSVMLTTAVFAEADTLIGDPTRANMLVALTDGRALTAKELAEAAGWRRQPVAISQLTVAGLLLLSPGTPYGCVTTIV